MSQPTSERAPFWVSRHFLAIALALVWVSAAVLQRFETPALGAQIATLALSAPLTLWAFSRGHLRKRPIGFLILASLPVLHLLGSSLNSANPTAALLGTPPHWHGWLLWAGVLAWFLAVLVGVERHDLTDISRVLAVAGGVSAVWALAEVAGVIRPYDPLIGQGMALFDNPLSLGQGLLVTLAATAALALRKRIPNRVRAGYGALALLQVVVLFATDARGALLGAALGVVAFAVTETGRTRWRRALFLAGCAGAVAFLIAFAGVAAAWTGMLGASSYERTDALLTQRLSIWTDVAELSSESPLLGVGPAQFDTIVDWQALPDGSISEWFTYTEHSLLLTWLLDTGVLGFAFFGLAAAAVSLRFLQLARAPSATAPIRALVGGGVATFVAMLSAWPDPLTLLSVSVIAGGLIGTAELQPTKSGWAFPSLKRLTLPAAATVLAATVFALYALAPEAVAQYRVASARVSHPANHRGLADAFRNGYRDTGDVFYVEELLLLGVIDDDCAMTNAESVALVRDLAADYPEGAEGRADIPALALETLWKHRTNMEADEFWTLSQFFVNEGIRSDPDMAIWPYALARAAYGAQRPETTELITRAFDTTQPASAQMIMVQWQANAIR